MMTFDVIIPTAKNVSESNYSICFTIRSILSQNYLPKNIFVVENDSNIGAKDVLSKEFGNIVKILDGSTKSPNISYARNIGVQESSSEIIVFMDDDVILGGNDYFKRIISIMEQSDFCCGAFRYWTNTEWHKYLSLNYQMNHNLMILKSKSFLPQSIERSSGNLNCSEYSYIGNLGAIKRNVFNAIGGFDEDYEGWLYQDTDLMMRLCYHNHIYEILSYTGMFCYHLAHAADKQLYRKINKDKYTNKQIKYGIKFNNYNFFGRFNSESVAVLTPLSEE